MPFKQQCKDIVSSEKVQSSAQMVEQWKTCKYFISNHMIFVDSRHYNERDQIGDMSVLEYRIYTEKERMQEFY